VNSVEGVRLHRKPTHCGQACHLALGGVCDRLLYPLRQPRVLDGLHFVNDACRSTSNLLICNEWRSICQVSTWSMRMLLGIRQDAPLAFNL
jgi:hypothetical protein